MSLSNAGRAEYLLGSLEGPVQARLQKLEQEQWAKRVFEKDAGLWTSSPAIQKTISNRLGWLTAPELLMREVPRLEAFAKQVKADGFTGAVVLGMGGASLAPACLAKTFGQKSGFLRPAVLDLTAPSSIRALEAELDLAKTLFLVASKSGETTESRLIYDYFNARMATAGTANRGRHFCAVTDEGSPLAALAKEEGFREALVNPSDIGGRYSALSLFGLVPAALQGIELDELLRRGAEMAMASRNAPAKENPALKLGAVLGEAALAGHDKATLIANDKLCLFGAWAEQLLAASTGKNGKGIIPVDREPLATGDHYGDDRLFIGLLLGDHDPLEPKLRALAGPTRPLVLLKLRDTFDLGGEFFRFELATALAGAVLGVNPFDEPDVLESKQNTTRILKQTAPGAAVTFVGSARAVGVKGNIQSAAVELKKLLSEIRRGDYLALQAYLPEEAAIVAELAALRVRLRDRLKIATTVGFGPRLLHSTGQLHKGGPNTGVFIQFTGTADVVGRELPIPGTTFGFGRLLSAQAEGDRESLRSRGRRLVHVELSDGKAGIGEVSNL